MVFTVSTVSDDAEAGPGSTCSAGGRIVLLCDNSPVALILPTDLNSFLKTSDDYYNRFGVATFARILRYMAAFLP